MSSPTLSVMRATIAERTAQRDELLAALKALTQTMIDGSHYETQNPYTRPQVKQALIAIGKAEGKSVFGNDWIDALHEWKG